MANTKEGDLKTYLGRMWPRFAATGLEPGTRGRRYYDRRSPREKAARKGG